MRTAQLASRCNQIGSQLCKFTENVMQTPCSFLLVVVTHFHKNVYKNMSKTVYSTTYMSF